MKVTNLKPYLAEKAKVGLFFLQKKSIQFFSLFLYTSLYKLPLGKYIDVVVDGMYKSLRIVPIPCPQYAYIYVYGKLHEEYAKLAGNAEYKGRVSRQDEITFIKYQLFFYSHALKLIVAHDNMTGAIEYLKQNGFEGTREELINQVTGELMGLKSNLDDLEHLEKQTNPQTESKKITRADYSKTIAVACKNGYYVDYQTSVADFIHILATQKEEFTRLNSKK